MWREENTYVPTRTWGSVRRREVHGSHAAMEIWTLRSRGIGPWLEGEVISRNSVSTAVGRKVVTALWGLKRAADTYLWVSHSSSI